MTSAKHTTNHDRIRTWAEERGGVPSFVEGTSIIRIDFKEDGPTPDEKLEEISWEKFFEVFEENGLALLYRDEDRFNKFIDRNAVG